MYAGQLLSAIKLVICGRLTESPLQLDALITGDSQSRPYIAWTMVTVPVMSPWRKIFAHPRLISDNS